MKNFIYLITFIVLPFIFIEINVSELLFKRVKYTNVDAFDAKIELYSSSPSKAVFIGSSEVHWGISPKNFDRELNQQGLRFSSFNFGLNGMTLDRYVHLLPYLFEGVPYLRGVQKVFIGLNFSEPRSLSMHKKDCQKLGDFEKPIYFSSFAKDTGLYYAKCSLKLSEKLIIPFEHNLNTMRYRSSIRDYVFSNKKLKDIEKLKLTERGFHYRESLNENEHDFLLTEKWFKQANNYKDLSDYNIETILNQNGLLDTIVSFLKRKKIEVVIFNNPTNPRMINVRRENLNLGKNIIRLRKWCNIKDILCLDVAAVRNFHPLKDFADRRHLSHDGAKKFSSLLAKKYLEHTEFNKRKQ